jgi:hypothetical protein
LSQYSLPERKTVSGTFSRASGVPHRNIQSEFPDGELALRDDSTPAQAPEDVQQQLFARAAKHY